MRTSNSLLINYFSNIKNQDAMKTKKAFNLFLLAIIALLFTSCVPGSENFQESAAGFFMGLWHGFISFFTFIIGLFVDGVGIYEINNNGSWYNFGFIIGVSVFFGGSSKGACRRCKWFSASIFIKNLVNSAWLCNFALLNFYWGKNRAYSSVG